jgi:hypothetical protein
MRIVLIVAALLLAAPVAMAQTPPKVIGTPQQPQIMPSMIVINAQGARIEGAKSEGTKGAGQKLVLEGVSPNAIVFADRPIRAAGHALTSQLLEEWSDASADSFAKDPPNATISVMRKEKGKVSDAVVVLKSPKLEGERLTFDISLLEGDLAQADGPATLFIDIIDMPVARRTAHHSAWYAGAK